MILCCGLSDTSASSTLNGIADKFGCFCLHVKTFLHNFILFLSERRLLKTQLEVFCFFFAQSYLEWQLWVACFTTMSTFALPRHDVLPFNVKTKCIFLWGNCNTRHRHLFSRWHLLNYLSCFTGTNVVPIFFHWNYIKPITILKITVETTNVFNTSHSIVALAKVCFRIWLHETRYKRSWQVLGVCMLQWKNVIIQIVC